MNESPVREQLPQTWSVIQDGIARQLHTGCQIYVSYQGQTIANDGVGESFPGQPMSAQTINLWLSAGKPLTAVSILQQWERNKLRLDSPVAEYIPEFAVGGKERITLRHLLTHTGGFRNVETGWPDVDWNESIRRICSAPLDLDWVIGRTAGYHASTSWFILGEILARLHPGHSYADLIQRELFEPIGLQETWAAMTPALYEHYGSRIGRLFTRERGELQLLDWHNAHRCAAPSPGSNLRGPICELGRFYEMLLNEGQAATGRVVSPQTVAALTARHRVGEFDLTLAHVVDFGLGVILDSNRYGIETVPYGYGRHCSPRTFGHGGAQSSQGWCDPECGLVVAYFFNGRAGEGQHNRRARSINEAIYSDVM